MNRIRVHANDKVLLVFIVMLWIGIVVAVENIQLNTRGTIGIGSAAVSSTPGLVVESDLWLPMGSERFAFVQ